MDAVVWVAVALGAALAIARLWQLRAMAIDHAMFARLAIKLIREGKADRARKLTFAAPAAALALVARALLVQATTLRASAGAPSLRESLEACRSEALDAQMARVTRHRAVSILALVLVWAPILRLMLGGDGVAWGLYGLAGLGTAAAGWAEWMTHRLSTEVPAESAAIVAALLEPPPASPDASPFRVAPRLDADDEVVPAEGEIVVVVRRKGEPHATVPLSSDIIKIGKAPTSHVCLDDPAVSRMHAVVERSGATLTVIDLGSDNGTHVRGERVNKTTLGPGDVVRIADFELSFRLGDAGGGDAPAPAKEAPLPAGEGVSRVFYGFDTCSPDPFYDAVNALAGQELPAARLRISKLRRAGAAPRHVVAVEGAAESVRALQTALERASGGPLGGAWPAEDAAPDAVYPAGTRTHHALRAEMEGGAMEIVATTET